jgi:hypothetical protein
MKWAAAAVLVMLAAAMPARADAFCRKTTCDEKKSDCAIDEKRCSTVGEPLRWKQMPLVYRFSARGSGLLVREEARAAIREAFHRWSDTVCSDGRRTSLRFVEGEDLAEDKPLVAKSRGSEPFGIYFRDLGWPYDGVDETLAQTNQSFGSKSGFIEYADIEVNTGARRFSANDAATGVDLQAVVTHEVGHYIGLAHSVEPDSIMASGYCELDSERCDKGKVAARRLAADDISAVCTLFPPDAPPAAPEPASTGDEATGCTISWSRTTSNRSVPANGFFAFAGAFVGVALARRARRRRLSR